MVDCPAACGKQFYSYHVTLFLMNLVNQLVDVSHDDRLRSRDESLMYYSMNGSKNLTLGLTTRYNVCGID